VEAYEQESEEAKQQWEEQEALLAQAEEEAKSPYVDGTYQGSGMGFGGEILVEVTIADGEITKVEILSAENETPDYLTTAETLTDEIVKKQSFEVDTVSGATLSSNGILDGAKEALSKAEKNQ
jgi:uncharacterized protein with FMN-binding domain